jgi:hypothetical protein
MFPIGTRLIIRSPHRPSREGPLWYGKVIRVRELSPWPYLVAIQFSSGRNFEAPISVDEIVEVEGQ